MTFDAWIGLVFDRPVLDRLCIEQWDEGYWDGPAATIVDYLHRSFNQCGTLLAPFSDAQIGQGLDFLISPGLSDYSFALQDDDVPLGERLDCIAAIEAVYRDCFAPRCADVLSHLDEAGNQRLNAVCYMWWDIFPLMGLARHRPESVDSPALDRAVLNVLRRCLTVDSAACIESALHGLGHAYFYYPEVTDIIDQFLLRSPSLHTGLRRYALAARRGMVQ